MLEVTGAGKWLVQVLDSAETCSTHPGYVGCATLYQERLGGEVSADVTSF